MALEGSGGDLDGDLEGRMADEKDETDSCSIANSSCTGVDIAPPEGFGVSVEVSGGCLLVYALGERGWR